MAGTTHVRQQEALAFATRCTQILGDRFGARRVIPFGSVVGHGKWHPGSDLDLAVEGIPLEQFFQAFAALRKLLPPGLDVDLVDLAQAGEALRARILGEKTMAEEPVHALKELVEDALAALGYIVQAVQEGLGSLEEPLSQFALNALASYLYQLYTGCERILERLAITIDGGLPGGAFSHANLLAQMARELLGIRPAVLHEALWLHLQDYLAFRHFYGLRHRFYPWRAPCLLRSGEKVYTQLWQRANRTNRRDEGRGGPAVCTTCGLSSLALSARTGYTATHSGCDCLVTLIPARCLAMAISSSSPKVHVDYPSEDGQPMAESDFQREPLTYAVEALGAYFQERVDVYVSGDLFIYYEEGNPEAVVAPDVFVVFGAPQHRRSSYMLWNEPKAPDFVMEITSRRTRSQDQGPKRGTYAFLGVQEYVQYDPTSDYLRPPLRGLSLVGDNYEPMPTTVLPDGTLTLYSNVLGLELRLVQGVLRFVDPTTSQQLLSHREAEQARQEAEQARQEAEQARQEAEQARQEAEEHARREAAARAEVEARLAAVEAQLRALREQAEGPHDS